MKSLINIVATKNIFSVVIITAISSLSACGGGGGSASNVTTTQTSVPLSALETLGQSLYFDENLSSPAGQSCASCHTPTSGFADPDSHFPVSEGVISGLFGNRNSPTASYAATIPAFQFDTNRNRFIGGLFLDGRAASLEEQAMEPFLNSLEMNNTKEGVIEAIRISAYANNFNAVFGEDALDNIDTAYALVADAIAAFERSNEFSPFTSKFDAVQANLDSFTVSEQRGLNLYRGKAACVRCHSMASSPVIFTDFSYRNLGVPANSDNPFYQLDSRFNPDGINFIDRGLGGVLNDANENGKFRVPTLRNIALTPPYMHNGLFNSLQEVIDFYNTRDTNPLQQAAEVDENKDNRIGNLGLTQNEIEDLIDFLNTLNDGYIN